MVSAYPLQWPQGKGRTAITSRSNFMITQHQANIHLLEELRRLGAKGIVISTNIKLRNDGMPYTSQKPPEDRGVAVYFNYKGKSVSFACDRWDAVGDNMQAIRHTIYALRGIARWGTGDMVAAAFSGFEAIAGPAEEAPPSDRVILGLGALPLTMKELKAAYKAAAKKAHPDFGGSNDAMVAVNLAYRNLRGQI